MTALVLLACVFATYRLTTLVTRDAITIPARRRLAKRFPARAVPVYDPNGDQALIHNEASLNVEPAVTMAPHWLVAFVNCDRCVSWWLSAVVVLTAHGVGLLDRWALVGLGWLAVAGAVALIADVAG